jgi:hypothetical protein
LQQRYRKEIKNEQKILKEKYVTKKRASSHEPLASVRKAIEAFLLIASKTCYLKINLLFTQKLLLPIKTQSSFLPFYT